VTGCADSIAPDSTGTVSLRGVGTGIASATRAGVGDVVLELGGGEVGEDDLDDPSGFDSPHSCFFGMPVETGSLSSSIASSG
jgi:hypothetical protein